MHPLRAVTRADPLFHVRRGAMRLSPTWVELPAPRPRLYGFASDIVGDDAERTLILAPIDAGQAADVGDRVVVVRSAAPEAPFVLRARGLYALDARTLAVPLHGARVGAHRRRQKPRRRPDAREPLMLVLPGGVDGADTQVLPIVDLSRDGCAVDTVSPLEPGRVLDPVEVVGTRRVLRVAAAIVQEVLPWRSHRGDLRFRCRLTLAPNGRVPADPLDDLIGDARRTRRVLELAAMVERAAWVADVNGPRREARLLALDEHCLRIRTDLPGDTLRTRSVLRFGFELFAVSYEGDARVVARHGRVVELACPLVLRRRRRRRKPRVDIPGTESVELEFHNAAEGGRVRRRVIDASFGGLCFNADPRRDVLWPGLPLEDAVMRWRGREMRIGDLEVRSVGIGTRDGGVPCHAEMLASVHLADDAMLVDLLATLGHPELRVHEGDGYRDVLATYDAAGLLGDYMKRNLKPVAPAAAVHWRRLHRAPVPIARTLMHPKDGPPDATLSALRAWDRTWLIQHFGALSADGFRWSGELQSATLDWIIPRPDGDYLLFFVHSANSRMNAFYERFVELTGTPEATARDSVSLWTLPDGTPTTAPVDPAGVERVPVDGPLERVVARAAEALLGAMVAQALSFEADELDLPECRRRFERAALLRTRTAEVVEVDNRPRLALLHEEMSAGLNLTWMQQATWLLPIGSDVLDPRALGVAFPALRERPPPSLEGDRFVLLPGAVSGTPLSADGWRHVLDANLYVMNRAGLHRFYHYVADRYGEVDVRKARHEVRRALRRAAGERTG